MKKLKRWFFGNLETIIASAIIGSIMLMAAVSANAAPLTAIKADYMYAVAYGQFGGPPEWLRMKPNIRAVTQAQLCELTKMPADCRVVAAYHPGNVSYLNTLDFDTLLANSILLHEFIHHFQFLKHGDKEMDDAIARNDVQTFCRVLMRDERQAYDIQISVLLKDGGVHEAEIVADWRHNLRCNPYRD